RAHCEAGERPVAWRASRSNQASRQDDRQRSHLPSTQDRADRRWMGLRSLPRYLRRREMELQAIDDVRYRIPRDQSRGMRTEVIVYASHALIEQIRKDQSLEQAMNVAMLPGIVGPSLAMP